MMNWAEIYSELVHRKFRRRKDGRQETRFVADVTLGGTVCFRYGPRFKWEKQVLYAEWKQWQADAKEIK